MVKAGDVIAELDPRDYQVAVENAEAALASAQANAAAANVNVPITTVNTGSNLQFGGRRCDRHAGRRWTGGAAAERGAGPRGAGPGQRHQGAGRSRSATSRWSRRT